MKTTYILLPIIVALASIGIYIISNTSTPENNTYLIDACEYNRGEYELRVYDSQGRMTGIKNRVVEQDIPDSFYFNSYEVELGDEENTTFWMPAQVLLYNITETYIFEIFGTKEGNYRLNNKYTLDDGELKFNASNIPIMVGETHQYHYDWDALRDGKEGITLLIDKESDGEFETTIYSDSTLTCQEYLSETKDR